MRYTKPVRFIYSGNRQAGISLRNKARTFIGKVLNKPVGKALGRKQHFGRFRFDDGTEFVVQHSHSIVNCHIYVPPKPLHDPGPPKALFLVRPKIDYPQVMVYEDPKAPNGVRMRFADDLFGGSIYTQALDDRRELMLSILINHNGDTYPEGSACSLLSSVNVFSNGYRIAFFTGITIIGAAVVEDKKLVFVTKDSGGVKFYSHPMITIDFTETDYIYPAWLIVLADCTLVYTISHEVYTGGAQGNYTACTFNKEGTKAVTAALIGGSDAPATLSTQGWGSTTEQDIYDVTLYVNDSDDLIVSHVLDHTAYKRTVSATDAEETGLRSFTEHPVTAMNCDSVQNAFYVRNWTFIENFLDYDHQLIQDVPDAVFAVSMNSIGTVIKATTNYIGTRDYFEDLEPGLPLSGETSPTYREYSLENGSYPFGGHAYNVQDANYIAGIFNSRYDSFANKNTTRRQTEFDTIKYTYKFPWVTYSTEKGVDQQGVGTGVYGVPNGERFEVSPATECSPEQQRGTVEFSGDLVDDYASGTGYCLAKQEYSYPKQFSLRENVSITEHYVRPFQKSYMILESDTSAYGQPTIEFHPSEPAKYNKFGTRYMTLESSFGTVDIPGLPSWRDNLDKQDDSVSFPNTDYAILVLTDGMDNYDTDVRNLEIPTKSKELYEDEVSFETNTGVKLCTHPLGYAMYSMSDREMLLRQDGFNQSTTELTYVLGLFNTTTGNFTNLLAMYNNLIANDDRLDLAELAATEVRAGASSYDYMYKYGLVSDLPNTGIDPSIY